MLIGHYAPALALKAAAPRVPLWLLFVAVQLVDLGWSLLVLAGVEHARIVPGPTPFTVLDLHDMPWTHSVVAALVWSLAAGAATCAVARDRRAAPAVAAAVLSHVVLDAVVHRPDITVAGAGTPRVGLGLWEHPTVALAVETGLVAAAAMVLWRAPWSAPRRLPLALLIGALLIAAVVSRFVPAPTSATQVAVEVLAVLAVATLAAAAVDSRLLATARPDTADA